MDYEKEFRLSNDVNFGDEPIIMDGFEIELRGYVNDAGEKKRYCVLTMNTKEGNARFVMVPEELKKLSEVGLETIKDVKMREDYIPRRVVDMTKEYFKDMR